MQPKHKPRRLVIAAACLVAMGTAGVSGCRLARFGDSYSAGGPKAPTVIAATSPTAEIVAAVNANASRIRTLSAPNATFSMPGLPGLPLLRGSIVLERPRRLRLRAGTALSGEEVDLGSNDELFWLWAKRNDPPALYFARHDQASSAAALQLLPIQPSWVVDALGLVELNPAVNYQGPFPRADGTLELRGPDIGPGGPVERVTVVEPTRAWVVEQHVYDTKGELLASAVAKNFRFHTEAQASLPEQVTIRIPTAGLSLTINTGTASINAPIANPQQQWAMPNRDGYPQVDLGRSDGLPIATAQPAPSAAFPVTSTPVLPLTPASTPLGGARRSVSTASGWK